MKRFLASIYLLVCVTTASAQSLPPGTGFAAIPGEKGGQDIFGPYDIVTGWPKDTATVPGHEAWTFAAVRGVFAESVNRVFAVQLGELPNIERPEPRLLPEIGPGIGYPIARAPSRSFRRWELMPQIYSAGPGPVRALTIVEDTAFSCSTPMVISLKSGHNGMR